MPPNDEPVKPGALRTQVFLCYSQKDDKFLSRLLVHLKPLRQLGIARVWVDKEQLRPGDTLLEEVRRALALTRVAILLISIDFLTSDFVNQNELPVLLEAAEREGVRLIPVIAQPCEKRVARKPWLRALISANRPHEPLAKMTYSDREAFFDNLVAEIEDLMARSSAG